MAKVTDVTPGLASSFALDTVSLKLDLKKESAILEVHVTRSWWKLLGTSRRAASSRQPV